MRGRIKFLLSIIAIVALVLVSSPLLAQARLTEQSKVALNSIGPIRVGMTVVQAEKAAGVQLIQKEGEIVFGNCYYLWPKTGPQNLAFLVISDRQDNRIQRNKDRIARIDAWEGSRVTTLSGAKIGDTESRIKSLYPGRITVSLHKYTGDRGGHYLTFIPKDAADRNYRLIFETLNGRVTQFRSGRLPEVEYVEGCS